MLSTALTVTNAGFMGVLGGNTDLLSAIHIGNGTSVYCVLHSLFDMATVTS